MVIALRIAQKMARSCVEVGILDRDRRQEMVADDFSRSRAGTTNRGGPRGGTIGSPARGVAGDGLPKCECGPADLTSHRKPFNDASPEWTSPLATILTMRVCFVDRERTKLPRGEVGGPFAPSTLMILDADPGGRRGRQCLDAAFSCSCLTRGRASNIRVFSSAASSGWRGPMAVFSRR